MAYSIGQLSRKTGCQVQTIRYYEGINLLPAAARTEGNQRRFSEAHKDRLVFIRRSRELGFSLVIIRKLLNLIDTPDASCEEADELTQRHLEEVNSRIERLRSHKIELQRMLRLCRENPIGSSQVSDCRILEILSGD